MNKDEINIMTPSERAKELLAALELHASQNDALVAELLAERAKIDEALIDLGEKPKRKPRAEPKRRGRPPGSKNKVAEVPNA